MAGFRREALQDFVDTKEGDRPPVYVGREDIIERVETYARTSWKDPGALRHGVGKATTVVQGAQGAGKSALIHEIKGRSVVIGDHLPEQHRVVTLSSDELMDDLPQVLELVGVAGGLPARIWENLSADMSVGFDLEVVKARAGVAWTAPDQPPPTGLMTLKKRFPAHKWHGPVVVCVDETQNLERNRYTPHARFLRMIHNGESGLPLSLVSVGLSDTKTVLKEIGFTRLNVHEMDALRSRPGAEEGKSSEILDLMLSFCDHFGIDRTGQTEPLMALAEPCGGWPRHLHFALQAMGRDVLRTDGDLSAVNWPGIMREAADSRTGYYQMQHSDEMKDARILVAHVMRDFRDGMVDTDIKALVLRHAGDRIGQELPEGMTAVGFRRHLIHGGALHERKDGTYRCPIPSFRSFLIRAGGLQSDINPEPVHGKGNADDGTVPGY